MTSTQDEGKFVRQLGKYLTEEKELEKLDKIVTPTPPNLPPLFKVYYSTIKMQSAVPVVYI